MIGQGASMLAPTLLEHGTDEQKQRFVRATLMAKSFGARATPSPEPAVISRPYAPK